MPRALCSIGPLRSGPMPTIGATLFHPRIANRMILPTIHLHRMRPMAVSLVWPRLTPHDQLSAMVTKPSPSYLLGCCAHSPPPSAITADGTNRQ